MFLLNCYHKGINIWMVVSLCKMGELIFKIDGAILGCTEIGLLISQNDFDIKVFDTTLIHARQAVEYALNKVHL